MNNFKIKLSNTEWTINMVEPTDPILDGNQGYCIYRNDAIYVANNLTCQQIKNAIAHELAHALLAESGFNVKVKEFFKEDYEIFVDNLSKPLRNLLDARINLDGFIEPAGA